MQRTSSAQWLKCMGEFLRAFKCERFFTILPLRLMDYDMNSPTYSFDSRSYLIPVIKDYTKNEPLGFFTDNFLPLVSYLENEMTKCGNEQIKAKKYETLMIQIWDCLPCYLENPLDYNTKLGDLLPLLEQLVKTNTYGLRMTALKSFCTMIHYVKTTAKSIQSVKSARLGLMP